MKILFSIFQILVCLILCSCENNVQQQAAAPGGGSGNYPVDKGAKWQVLNTSTSPYADTIPNNAILTFDESNPGHADSQAHLSISDANGNPLPDSGLQGISLFPVRHVNGQVPHWNSKDPPAWISNPGNTGCDFYNYCQDMLSKGNLAFVGLGRLNLKKSPTPAEYHAALVCFAPAAVDKESYKPQNKLDRSFYLVMVHFDDFNGSSTPSSCPPPPIAPSKPTPTTPNPNPPPMGGGPSLMQGGVIHGPGN